jgi:hypothetical protein
MPVDLHEQRRKLLKTWAMVRRQPRWAISLVLVGVVFFVGVFFVEGFGREWGRRTAERPSVIAAGSVTAPPAPPAANAMRGSESDRLGEPSRIRLNKSPAEITQSVRDMNSIQRTVFVRESYTGKWMRVELPFYDASSGSPTMISLFDRSSPLRDVLIAGWFDGSGAKSALSHLHKGDLVRLEGRVGEVDGASITLEHCELLP